jgi:membrane associated rhomboid family serine protease
MSTSEMTTSVTPATPPSYRERLRIEGGVLALSGALASVLLLALVPEASERAGSTAGQIGAVLVLLAVLGPLSLRRWLAAAEPIRPGTEPTGEPTALWMPPIVVVVLVAIFVIPGELGVGAVGWDAGLRITLGCMLVGLTQALLLAKLVAADEKRQSRRYLRLPGSRAIGGTKLGFSLSKHV